jgi:hypothetical protein
MAELTRQLCRELAEFLAPELVKCFPDTIDYKRIDTHKLMKEMGKEVWSSYYTGSVWIDESKGIVGAGDVVVPIELTREMEKKLREFGCPPAYVHEHPEFRTSHIHISDCNIRNKTREFAKLVSE